MPDNPYLMNESDIPSSWEPVNSPPIRPSNQPSGAPAPPIPHDMPQFFSGSLPPNIQHDTSFVATEIGTPRIPKYSLMPLGIQGNPGTNAGVQSTIIKQTTTVGSSITLKTNGANNPNQSVLDLEPGTSNVSLAADGSGAVRISVVGGDTGPFMFRPDFKRWALWSQTGDGGGFGGGFKGINDALTLTTSGTNATALVAATTTDDYGVQISQSTNGGFIAVTGVQNLIPARVFSLFCPARIAVNSGNIRVWVIVSNPNNSGDISAIATSDTPNRDITGFRYNPAVSANWFAVQAQVGLGLTAVDTGIAAGSTTTMFRVDYDPATTTSTYFINGVQVATISTNPPTLTFNLGGMISVASTGAAGNNALNISSFYTEMRTTATTS